MTICNIFNVRRETSLPNKEIMHFNASVTVYANKQDQLVIEYKHPIGTFTRLVFDVIQERQLALYIALRQGKE